MASLFDQFAKFKSRLARNLLRGGLAVEGQAHKIVAVDTGKLDQSINTSPVSVSGNILTVDIGTNVFYAPFVEKGVKDKVFQYHRRKGASRPVVWVGVGQQFLERSVEATRSIVLDLLISTRI